MKHSQVNGHSLQTFTGFQKWILSFKVEAATSKEETCSFLEQGKEAGVSVWSTYPPSRMSVDHLCSYNIGGRGCNHKRQIQVCREKK